MEQAGRGKLRCHSRSSDALLYHGSCIQNSSMVLLQVPLRQVECIQALQSVHWTQDPVQFRPPRIHKPLQ